MSDEYFGKAPALLTGFPGFLARFLIQELVEREDKLDLTLLVEKRFRDRAERELAEVLSDYPDTDATIEIVVGDITREDLGLDDPSALSAKIEVVWHLAAIYDLAVDESVAYRVNVSGTSNVLDFCEKCDQLKRLNYVSTCYTAGKRLGRIFEDELDEGQAFNNHYESTKFWAEVEVQRRMKNIPTAIVRPSIVVGHSQTGETDKYDGPYYLLKVIKKLPGWLPFPQIGSGDSPVNIVPVDYVVSAMAEIGTREGLEGKVYQLADPNPMNANEIVDLGLKCLDRAPSKGRVPSALVGAALENQMLEEWAGIPREVVNYFTHDARYDVTHTQEALSDAEIRCPHLSDYMQNLVDYFELHPDKSFMDDRRI